MKSWRIQRDGLIIAVSLIMLVYEIVLADGRAAVLTALTTLLLSPIVMRLDEVRRDHPRQEDRP